MASNWLPSLLASSRSLIGLRIILFYFFNSNALLYNSNDVSLYAGLALVSVFVSGKELHDSVIIIKSSKNFFMAIVPLNHLWYCYNKTFPVQNGWHIPSK